MRMKKRKYRATFYLPDFRIYRFSGWGFNGNEI